MSASGGTIEVESELGTGSLFRVILPAAREPSENAPSASVPPSSETFGRLLAIDDDELVLRTLERSLKGHALVCVSSGKGALELLERGERFDVILSDMMMPEMTGMALFERLRRAWPDVAERVIFMTGDSLNPKVADFLATVQHPCIQKPFDLPKLRAAVQEVIEKGASRPAIPGDPPRRRP